MAETKKRKQLKTFPGLSAAEFQHPHDAAATEALASVPGLDMVVSKVLETASSASTTSRTWPITCE